LASYLLRVKSKLGSGRVEPGPISIAQTSFLQVGNTMSKEFNLAILLKELKGESIIAMHGVAAAERS